MYNEPLSTTQMANPAETKFLRRSLASADKFGQPCPASELQAEFEVVAQLPKFPDKFGKFGYFSRTIDNEYLIAKSTLIRPRSSHLFFPPERAIYFFLPSEISGMYSWYMYH